MNLLSFKHFKSFYRHWLKFLLPRRCSSDLSILWNIYVWYWIINPGVIKFIIRISSDRTSLIIYPKWFCRTWSIHKSIRRSSNYFKGRIEIFWFSSLWSSKVLSWRFEEFLLFLIWGPRRFLNSWIILSLLPSFTFRISFC